MIRYRAVFLILFGVAGCDLTDPYTRPGMWRPNGANDSNLRAMVTVPSDLAAATPAASSDGGMAAAAVARLRGNRVRPLLDSGVAQVVPVNAGGPPASAAAPTAALPAGSAP